MVGEMTRNPADESGERIVVRDISWLGSAWGTNARIVDVKDGTILRIRVLSAR
jgi:hypothetical protein